MECGRERSSKYFCNLEKRHFTEKAIPKLILDNGFEITNQDDILTQQHIFYESLFSPSTFHFAFVLIIIPLILSSLSFLVLTLFNSSILFSCPNCNFSDNHFIFVDENNPFIKKLNLEESEALEGDLKPEEILVYTFLLLEDM
jgi:hypothetical protein